MRKYNKPNQQAIVFLISIFLVFTTSSGFIIESQFIDLPSRISSQIAQITPDDPVVRAVLFWMDGCPHCHELIDHVLPPIQVKYGDQFQILLIELIGGQEVVALYELAESKGIPKESVGVPFLIIGEHTLVGSGQIPSELPGLIDKYMAEGGVDFPDSPALAPLLPTNLTDSDHLLPTQTNTEKILTETETQSAQDRKPTQTAVFIPIYDEVTDLPNGFNLAIITMIGMLLALFFSAYNFIRQSSSFSFLDHSHLVVWLNLILILIGLVVAGYLAYTETQSVSAICGPIGDCNTVQQSPYAFLFGFLPIGVIGVVGYLLILVLFIIKMTTTNYSSNLASLTIFVLTFFGTLFSLYLTYLEPFVIKAVCMWCLTSAVIMTLLLLLNLRSAISAFHLIKEKSFQHSNEEKR